MKLPVLTISAWVLLILCVAAWVRSYLPEHATVRPYRGSAFVVFYGQEQAQRIDPADNPSVEQTFGNPQYPGRPPRRWDTRQILFDANAWAAGPSWQPGKRPLAWSSGGFEFVANPNGLAEGYFIVGVPFWVLTVPLAAAAAYGTVAWRRRRAWRREGRCRRCGYDLRAATGTCPECGTAIDAGAPTPQGNGARAA